MTDCMIKLLDEERIPDCYRVRPDIAEKEPGYFERCLEEQRSHKRNLYIAYNADCPVGYIHLIFQPAYTAFQKMGAFEIQDLFVAPQYRRRGVGERLVACCEDEAVKKGAQDIGIGVGLYRDYGSAQRLYVRRGYIPDGAGIVYDNQQVVPGQMRAVDDLLCLKLVKSLV